LSEGRDFQKGGEESNCRGANECPKTMDDQDIRLPKTTAQIIYIN
jgi:hypothetical protein